MNKLISCALVAFLLSLPITLFAAAARTESRLPKAVPAASAGRERLSFNNDWSFKLGKADDLEGPDCVANAYLRKMGIAIRASSFSDASIVRLPHDWAVGLEPDPKGYSFNAFAPLGPQFPNSSIGWYARTFTVPSSDEGRRLWIEFDGVYRNCKLWVNGSYVGNHEPAYENFRFDITDLVKPGQKNDVVVRVDATQREGWWYEGAGIYRPVWLTKTDPLAVAPEGVYVHTNFPGKDPGSLAAVKVDVNVLNSSREACKTQVTSEILDSRGRKVGSAAGTATISAGGESLVHSSVDVKSPELWSIETPVLYTLVTRVSNGGKITDEVRTPFGIRSIKFDAAKGFLLNGKRVILKGVCMHQDYPAVGAAITPNLQEYRVGVIKSYGANAIRMSHGPNPGLLEVCDRMGVLVMDEVRAFGSPDYAIAQLRNTVIRDRNHPSVILWSLGNEEDFVQNTPSGRRMTTTVVDLLHRLDPTRPTTMANNVSQERGGVNAVVDVHGWNYGSLDREWAPYQQTYPEHPMVCTELNANNPMKGDPTKEANTGMPYNRASFWRKIEANPWISGIFLWTGFDYAGEPGNQKSWPKRHGDFGVVDRCGFRKELAWCWQALWSSEPMVHLPINWAGKDGEEIKVPVITNTDEVELLLNGNSLGRKPFDANLSEAVEWKVPFAPGTLECRGYRGGKLVAADRVETVGPATGIRLEAPRREVPAEWNQRALVNAYLVDAKGRRLTAESKAVTFSLSGPGTLVGVGNGDTSGKSPELSASVPFWNGCAQAVIATKPIPGTISITARVEGMPDQSLNITTLPVPAIPEVPLANEL